MRAQASARLLRLFTIIVLASLSVALNLEGKILWNDACTDVHDLGQARVILDNGKWHGGVTRDGNFVIPDVPAGTYVLSVSSHGHAFDNLRIDIPSAGDLPEVRPYVPGTPLSPPSHITLPYPLALSARGKYDFYVPRQSFNLLGMFQSPMMLMMVFTGVMVLAMPYLLKNMDPEALQDLNKRQSRIAEIQNSLQSGDFTSGLSAIMGDVGGADGSRESTASPTAASQGVRSRTGKNRRR